MEFTIRIIFRAVALRGVSWAYVLQSPSTFGSTWQSMQLRFVDAAMNPIVSMNSSTGIPLSTVTFLKACSDMSCLPWAAGAAWPANGATFNRRTIDEITSDPSFISALTLLRVVRTHSAEGPSFPEMVLDGIDAILFTHVTV